MRALISALLPAGSSCTRVHSRQCTKITAGRAAPPRAIAAPAILTGVAGGAIISEAESIVLGEKFLEAGVAKFGAGVEEEVVEWAAFMPLPEQHAEARLAAAREASAVEDEARRAGDKREAA